MKKDRIIALIGTTVFHIIVVLLLIFLYLAYRPEDKPVWPPEDTSELLLEGEYVKLGDVAQPQPANSPAKASAPQQAKEADDLTDAGEVAETPPAIVTSKTESPMKVADKPKPEKTGPTKEELEAKAKAKKQEETAGKINQRVNFGNTSSTNSNSGNPGAPNGNSNKGALGGTPGFNLSGRSLEHYTLPRGKNVGTIVITIRVNREGKVTSASYRSGKGAIAGDSNARNSCIAAAKESRFSVKADAPAEQIGTITYTFN
ncbi:MAG: hypothetical protein K2M05_09210 [Paramuribaculum sp.]|nr:hypothetical protein [Paramuribaculum sp.]MDE6304488.1 hypothetical protein [Paramuribaculum sp.]